jgi:membrane fusion protein, heavy metal efflux system
MTTSKNMTGGRRLLAAAVLVLAIAAAAFFASGGAGRESSHDHDHDHAEPTQGVAHDTDEAEHREPADSVHLDDGQIEAAGIRVAPAGPATIATVLQLPGEIRLNEDRTAHVVPRMAGVVEKVSADLGQRVRKGQVLAVIASTSLAEQRSELFAARRRVALARTLFEREKMLWEEKISAEQDYLLARQSLREEEIALAVAQQKLMAIGASVGTTATLNRYELRAPFDGVVVEKHLTLGEAIRDDSQVFTLSDLSTVWAETSVPARDLAQVRVGSEVTVSASAFDSRAHGTVTHVGALLGEQTRSALARVVLKNPDEIWRPGLFVSVALTAGTSSVPVAVAVDAIQTVEGRTVVFVRTADGFAARTVRSGRSDGALVEITEGLRAGEAYAVGNSFILKAELGKESAAHSH